MVVNYFGGNSFRIQSGEKSILVDPESKRLKADAYLTTLTPTGALIAEETVDGVDIRFPGEYEVKGIEIKGIPVREESTATEIKTAYLISWEEIKIAVLGHIANPPSAELIDALHEPDVLFIPVGGGQYLAPDAAAKVAKLLEPALVFPSLYKNPAEFLKAMGQKAEPEEKLAFKKKELLLEKNKVVVLKNN